MVVKPENTPQADQEDAQEDEIVERVMSKVVFERHSICPLEIIKADIRRASKNNRWAKLLLVQRVIFF